VRSASVHVQGERVGAIGPGLLVLVGLEPGDDETVAARLWQRLKSYRVFEDAAGRMNLNVAEAGGAVLLVPQFTLAADTRRGNRPSFTTAMPPERAEPLFAALVTLAQASEVPVAQGRFGANMQVALVNDGPVTFWLQVAPASRGE